MTVNYILSKFGMISIKIHGLPVMHVDTVIMNPLVWEIGLDSPLICQIGRFLRDWSVLDLLLGLRNMLIGNGGWGGFKMFFHFLFEDIHSYFLFVDIDDRFSSPKFILIFLMMSPTLDGSSGAYKFSHLLKQPDFSNIWGELPLLKLGLKWNFVLGQK